MTLFSFAQNTMTRAETGALTVGVSTTEVFTVGALTAGSSTIRALTRERKQQKCPQWEPWKRRCRQQGRLQRERWHQECWHWEEPCQRVPSKLLTLFFIIDTWNSLCLQERIFFKIDFHTCFYLTCLFLFNFSLSLIVLEVLHFVRELNASRHYDIP